jgi:phage tail sheath protein FI
VAGLAAQFDLSVGVHRSPANAELVGAVGVAGDFNDAHHAILNPAGINLIRPCNGRGIRVMGARTLIPEAPYHFVSVRRLMMMIRTALELSTQWAVFEPANDLTRSRLKLSVESFLNEIWRRGMLAGNVPAQAYRVTCDDSNNPQQQTDNGLLLMNVEVAPAIPGEFVLLRLSRIDDEQPASWE